MSANQVTRRGAPGLGWKLGVAAADGSVPALFDGVLRGGFQLGASAKALKVAVSSDH
jgi:hypothetical protein